MSEPSSADRARIDRGQIQTQLLRQQRRALEKLTELRDELSSPLTRRFLAALKEDGAGEAAEGVASVLERVEDALRTVEYCEAELHRQLATPNGAEPAEEALPPALLRFLDERKGSPGFSYEVRKDAVRGWTIRWKEHTSEGAVRGSGQFYERPYAWIGN